MITQTIQTTLTQRQLDPIVMRAEESGREIQFVLLDESEEPIDLTGLSIKYMMIKPDQNVIYADLVSGVLQQTEQMAAASGLGYYALRVMDDDQIIYTGQGQVIIDDHLIDDDTLESISEVDGLVFPDDFLTIDSPVAVINDQTSNTYETWSSSKISGEIAAITDEIIDDDTQGGTTTWSSNKIKDEILNDVADLIDDDGESTQTTWSSDKIADELSAISPTHVYSTTAQKVGEWTDGSDIYEVVMHFSSGKSILSGAWEYIYSNPIPSGAKIIDTKYISSGGAGTGWTSYNGETYQGDPTNNYVTVYGTCGNGINVSDIIWTYIV